MNTFIIILIVIGGLLALPFLLALFMRKKYVIQRNVVINAPQRKVFDYVKLLKNQDHFNKWVMTDPGMKKEFKGTDGTVGFIYAWNGNKQAGEGELELTALEEPQRIDSEIRFVRPFKGLAHVTMLVEPVTENQTKVTWSNKSKMNYPLNFLLGMVEKMLAKDMDWSLNKLKHILEE